ncbi:beta-L-arabinofuranosidase domain-containing protein, partial [Cellulomonas sp. GbtcB1]|uniref:beta-L-arabinofuranosidase domain-containing protein n=1 Tax=Cellulomonas sp. GbtcB1 TaxID=2824746 RepID=UPI001C2FD347
GHLVQAAVALHRGAGRAVYLALARRYAVLVVATFGPEGRAGYCGHPEVGTALVELYRETGHEHYLATARRMVVVRG